MKLLTLAPVLLGAATLANGLSIWRGDKQELVINGDLDIPGESPLQHCTAAHEDDLLVIEKVDLAPNPPLAGQPLLIKASGTFKEEIEEGAYVLLQVKYGPIKILTTKADLCEQIQNVDLECPIKEGRTTITKEVELPKEIPPGKYSVTAEVFSVDDEPITCLTATVAFGAPGFDL